MAEFMHREFLLNKSKTLGDKEHPCVYFPRVLFAGWESTPEEVSVEAPTGLNATLFDTLRYRKHSLGNADLKPGKSIVDASRVHMRRNEIVQTPHDVLGKKCDQEWAFRESSIFRVHHYTGSLEAYLSRPGDLRRTKEAYMERNKWEGEIVTNDEARVWLKKFVQKVGPIKARQLTQARKEQAFRDDTKANEQIRKSQIPNRRKFVNYTSSPWEQLWLENIGEWQSDKEGFCRRLQEQKDQVDAFVKHTCSSTLRSEGGQQYCILDWSSSRYYYDLAPEKELSQAIRRSLPFSSTKASVVAGAISLQLPKDLSLVLSTFVFEDTETGEQYTEYIEPLVGDLRHPLEQCLKDTGDDSSKYPDESISSSLPRDNGKFHSPLTAGHNRFPNATGNYYLTLGWNDGEPSLSTVTSLWERHGIRMDGLSIWGTNDSKSFRESLPVALKDRVEYFEQESKIETERDHNLKGYNDPKRTFVPMVMREKRSRNDYILLNLMWDPGFRTQVHARILDHFLWHLNNYVEWIDELIWTKASSFDELSKSYSYCLKLRQRGVRAHTYV